MERTLQDQRIEWLRRDLAKAKAENDTLRAAVARVRALCDEADLFGKRGVHPNRIRAALPPTEQT